MALASQPSVWPSGGGSHAVMGLPEWAYRVREAIRHDLASADDVDAVFKTLHALGHALQSLYDEQNDAPLETRRAQWERAMRFARNALRMYDEGPGVGNQPGGA